MNVFSFDVESLGLTGVGFAVGWTIFRDGLEIDSGFASVDHEKVYETYGCSDEDLAWVEKNVIPHLPAPTHKTLESMRTSFWKAWTNCGKKALMLTEHGYPVEMNFLNEVRKDDPPRMPLAAGPLPLVDISSYFAIIGLELMRDPNEMPAHHPVKDARFTARKMHEILKLVNIPQWAARRRWWVPER